MESTNRIGFALALLLAAGSAQALEQFVGLQYLRSESSCTGFRDGVAPLGLGASCREHDNGYRLSYGAWFNESFGVEVGYQDAGEGRAETFVLADGTPGPTLTAPFTAFDAVFLARARLGYGIDLVGRVGAARWDYEVRSSSGGFGAENRDTTFTYGLAVEWRYLTVGYDVVQDVGQENSLDPTAPDIRQDIKRFSVGVKLRF